MVLLCNNSINEVKGYDYMSNELDKRKVDIFENLSDIDTGDEMQRRIRYQHLVAEYLSLLMYSEKISYKEIFCEHHEDILGVYDDNRLAGIQVKTKDRILGLNKLNDEAIESSIIRFVKLEKEYSNRFLKYVIISNNEFLRDTTGWSITTLQNKIYANPLPNELTPNTLEKVLCDIQNKAKCTRQELVEVLKKTEFQPMPDFNEIESVIIHKVLPDIEGCAGLLVEDYETIVQVLISMVYSASSKDIRDPLADYVHLLEGNALTYITQAEVNTKRVTKAQIKEVLSSAAKRAFYLSTAQFGSLSLSPDRETRMNTKMNAGMIDQDAIIIMNDLRDNCERYFINDFHKNLDRKESEARFTHIKTIVRNQAIEAKIETKNDLQPYGENMLIDIDDRLKDICKYRSADVDHCPYEILKGLVGSLTGECLIQFSKTPEGGWDFEK